MLDLYYLQPLPTSQDSKIIHLPQQSSTLFPVTWSEDLVESLPSSRLSTTLDPRPAHNYSWVGDFSREISPPVNRARIRKDIPCCVSQMFTLAGHCVRRVVAQQRFFVQKGKKYQNVEQKSAIEQYVKRHFE